MTNGYGNRKPNMTLQTEPNFSAAMAAAGLVPLVSVTLSELPEASFDLALEVTGVCDREVFVSFPRRAFHAFDTSFCGESRKTAVIRFRADELSLDRAFLMDLQTKKTAKLCVKASVGRHELTAEAELELFPSDEWMGLERYPETLAAFVCPTLSCMEEAIKEKKPLSVYATTAERINTLRELVSTLRAQSLVCAARDSYAPERRQRIKHPASFCTPQATSATPMELALLFSSFAERSSLAPIFVFASNMSGVTSLFCGIRAPHAARGAVSESLSALRQNLSDGAYIVFDPAILSSAQSIDVMLAASEAQGYLTKASTSLLAVLDVAEARENGVTPLFADRVREVSEKKANAREALAEVYRSLADSTALKICGGSYKELDVLPFVGFSPDELPPCKTEITVGPMEISEKPARFAALADDFAAFALKDERRVAYNKAELEQNTAAYEAFRRRIALKPYTVVGVYEKSFHERASRMTFGSASEHTLWLIPGFLRLCKRESGETRYLPLGFVSAHMRRDYEYSFVCEHDEVLINPFAASFFGLSEERYAPSPAALLQKLRAGATVEDESFSEIRIIAETALIDASLSELMLYDRIAESGARILESANLSAFLTGVFDTQKLPASYELLYPRFASQVEKQALSYDGNIAFSSAFSEESTDFSVNMLFRTLSDGKTAFVASEDPSYLNALKAALDREGLSEAVLSIDEHSTADELCDAVRRRVDSLQTVERSAAAPHAPSELDEAIACLKKYEKALTEPDAVFEASVLELIEAFDRANAGNDISSLLPVEPKAFQPLNAQTFDALFENAERLVKTARETLSQVSLSAHTPLAAHPLAALKPNGMPTEAALSEASELIARILPTLSEYREVFLDIAEPLGFDLHDMQTSDSLYHLNELYRTLISAREYDISIPADTVEPSTLADETLRRQKAKDRMENLAYRLRFFSPELFEDADALLAGCAEEKKSENGFIRKFWVKKNHKDVLLQYVTSENRAEFAKHPIDELYRLLNEYCSLRRFLGDGGAKEENDTLAGVVAALRRTLMQLYPFETDATAFDRRISKLLAFVTRLTHDAELSRRLTFARAHFAQVYTENDCMLRRLGELLGIDFASLRFENGALDYDGLSAYLKRLEENLPALESRMHYLDAERAAEPMLASFVRLLREEGLSEETDRRMAASLLYPACLELIEKKGLLKKYANVSRVKDKYASLCEKYVRIATETALEAHRQRVKHFCETDSFVSAMENDRALSVRAFLKKYNAALLRVFPLILTDTPTLCTAVGKQTADTLLLETTHSSLLDLAALATASRTVLISGICRSEALFTRFVRAGALSVCAAYHTTPVVRGASLLADGTVCLTGADEASPKLSLITVNGAMRRYGDLANPVEAEDCVSRALSLAADGTKTVIFAFTHGQCAYLRHLLCLTAENDKTARERILSGTVVVRNAFETCYEAYDNAVFSFGAAADGDSLCKAFCAASLKEFRKAVCTSLGCVRKRAFFVTSLSERELAALTLRTSFGKELALILGSAGTSYPLEAGVFDGAHDPDSALYKKYPTALPACGILACGADAVSGNTAYLYDCTADQSILERMDMCEVLRKNGRDAKCIGILETVPGLLGALSDSNQL